MNFEEKSTKHLNVNVAKCVKINVDTWSDNKSVFAIGESV